MFDVLLFIQSALISFLLTGVLLRFSLKRRLLDIPNHRSSHQVAKPRLGGMAIVISFYLTCLTYFLIKGWTFQAQFLWTGYLAGGGFLTAVGLVDDVKQLSAKVKLVAHIAAAVMVIWAGGVISVARLPLVGAIELGPFSIPVTILWIVALINFYNFIDGIDGLAAGIAIIASLFLMAIGVTAGINGSGIIFVILAGASFGFLRYNLPPARIFMGDAGSTFIGFTFAVMAVFNSPKGIPVVVTLLLLGGVIGDAAITLLRRVINRKRIFSPHRTHYYQRLTDLGLSHKQVTLLEYLVAILLGVSALFIFHSDRVFVVILSVIWIGFFLWTVVKIRKMEQGEGFLWRSRTLAIAVTDLFFIGCSYVLSYYLRLNFRFPQAETASMLTSIPIVLVIRTFTFYYYGLYRGVWRYTSFNDLMKIMKAVTVGSVIMVVSFTLLFRFEAFPRSVFVIDWFILTVFLAGSRIVVRWFHELPPRDEISGRRVIIGGTGTFAELLLAEIKRKGGFAPVGYLDDRVEMWGRMVQGLEVLGPFRDAAEIAEKNRVDEIIIPEAHSSVISSSLRRELESSGVGVRIINSPDALETTGETSPEREIEWKDVAVTGNGQLVKRAGQVFSGSSSLVVISGTGGSEGGRLRGRGSCPPDVCYYGGVQNNRSYLDRILRKHRPDYIFADFSCHFEEVENPAGAFLREVLFPLEKLAGAVSGMDGATLIVSLCRIDQPGSRGADLLLEGILAERFSDYPGRLILLEYGPGVSPSGLVYAAYELLRRGGGRYRVREDEGVETDHLGEPEKVTGVRELLGRLKDDFSRGNEEKLKALMDEFGHITVMVRDDN